MFHAHCTKYRYKSQVIQHLKKEMTLLTPYNKEKVSIFLNQLQNKTMPISL